MMRLSILMDELQDDFESALRQCDRYLVDYSSDGERQWGLIDKARILSANRKTIGALKLLRQLSRSGSGEGIPQALYLLGVHAADQNRTDDAVFYYNVFREGYPAAVGLDDLVDRLSGLSAATDTRAEELTGTFYSVKVGVFSRLANARRQADSFRRYNQKIDIKSKNISGRKYHVVYVGRFTDYQEAVTFRLQLEAAHKEVFQVVTR